jgi:DNA primase catalytic subunit
MSEQVQSILEAVRSLDSHQRRELAAALAAQDAPLPAAVNERRRWVEAIKGKYRHIPTSSEEFIDRKKEDIGLESRS